MPIALRAADAGDRPFLFRLYCSTREAEMGAWGWDAAQRESFLKMQFAAQTQDYRAQFPHAEHQIILLDSQPIGRIVVARDDEIRLVDIALLPEHRGAGIGTALMRDLLAEAEQEAKPVRLQVQKSNRAIGLYERLGFSKTGDTGAHLQMEWRAGAR